MPSITEINTNGMLRIDSKPFIPKVASGNYMNYKKDNTADTYIFKGEKKKSNKFIKFDKSENPFKKLLSLNIK